MFKYDINYLQNFGHYKLQNKQILDQTLKSYVHIQGLADFFRPASLISVTANNCFLWLEHRQGLAWVVTEASSMMKWGPMRVTVTSNVNFDSWLMNIKIVGAVHYLVIGPHCLNASECHFVGQKSLLIPSPASCPVHSSAVPSLLACLPWLYTGVHDGRTDRRYVDGRRRHAAGVPRDVTNEFSSTACRYKSA